MDQRRNHQQRDAQHDQGRNRDCQIKAPFEHPGAQTERARGHHQCTDPGFAAGAQNAQFIDLIVNDFAAHLTALEHHCPEPTPVRWAAYHHAVHVADHRCEPVKHMGIIQRWRYPRGLGVDPHAVREIDRRTAIVDHQQVHGPRAYRTANQPMLVEPQEDHQEQCGDKPGGKAEARNEQARAREKQHDDQQHHRNGQGHHRALQPAGR